jgi:hypothetical protein
MGEDSALFESAWNLCSWYKSIIFKWKNETKIKIHSYLIVRGIPN